MVLALYNRPHMQTQEAFKDSVTLEALARNPKRFARLMNVYNPMPWGKSTDYAKASMGPQGYISLKDDKPWGDDAKLPKPLDLMVYDREFGKMMQKNQSDGEISFPDHYK